jgi:DNA-binding MarR family transcriptional regulator
MMDQTFRKPETEEVERSLNLLLYDAARLMRRDFDRRAKLVGLTTRAQYAVLAHLSYSEGINQSALADLLDIEPITLARQLDRLEEAGMVERRPDPNDRRARTLYLTPKTWPILDQIHDIAQESRSVALDGLSEEQKETLIDLLVTVRSNFSDKEGSDVETS